MSLAVPTAPPGLDSSALRELDALVSGRLVRPGDPGWDAARTPWLVNVDQRPAAVLECAGVDDVVAAVRWAVDHGTSVAAQPRGHAARTALDGAVLLRTGALDDIDVDLARRTARVGAGVPFGRLMQALDGTGLTALCGSNPDPSVVGLALGGGVSWFTRKHGFTANSVVAFDAVDATGSLVHVTRGSDPDLFWALRGGGGDFAVVVAAELALFPAPELYGGRLFWPREEAGAVLRAFRDLALVAPRDLTLWAHLYHFPPLPELPEPVRGRSFVSVAATYLGPAADAEEALRPLRDAAPVELDLMGPVAVGRLGDVAAEPTDPMPAMEQSTLLEALDDAAIDALAAATADPATCPLMIVQIRGLGGAFAEPAPGGGAVCPVAEPFQLWAGGVPVDADVAAAITASFAAVDGAVARLASARRMPNFTGEAQPNAAGYDAATLARLRELKRARDPHGVIRSNKPVLEA
jgi:FAD/FMN-containing dehydrogenase